MNIISKIPNQKKRRGTGDLKDLIRKNFNNSRTAFIGKCGTKDEGLFLITYECIVLAEDPSQTWNCDGCEIKVIRFVDVNITVIGESKDE